MTTPGLLENFVKKTGDLPYQPKGIYPSEMFLFYSSAVEYLPEMIIESGVGFGGSTSYLSRLFPELPIVCIDDGKYRKLEKVAGNVGPNVRFKCGDSRFLLPDTVHASGKSRIVVLIDGPKGYVAAMMAQWMLTETPKVRMVAVHDLAFDEPGKYPVQSHDQQFRKDFAHLDNKVDEKRRAKHPNGPGLSIFTQTALPGIKWKADA